MQLEGLSISGFRSFGVAEQRLDNLQKLNFIVGRNNSGKSNVLKIITTYLNDFTYGATSRGQDEILDRPVDANATKVVVGLKLQPAGAWMTDFLKDRLQTRNENPSRLEEVRGRIFKPGTDAWLYYAGSYGRHGLNYDEKSAATIKSLEAVILDPTYAFDVLAGMQGGDLATKLSLIGKALNVKSQKRIKCDLIPAVRSVFNKVQAPAQFDNEGQLLNEGLRDFGGAGLIQKLEQLERPKFDRLGDRNVFSRIKRLMQNVLEDDSFDFYISHDTEQVIVELGGKSLPLQSLGTGIDQLFLIAATCMMLNDQIVCIEEIENHLHPTLQRQLVRHLFLDSSNQYFISTHSGHALDAADCSVYEIKLDHERRSNVRTILTGNDRHSAIRDLGYKPSDIVQANSIVWVEGPSDRIYLLKWLNLAAPNLVEGTHFSIMFYGGRLLSHLSAEDELLSEFIRLTRINQKVALVMDSDKAAAGATINATKQRLIDELAKSENHSWLTMGRTVENYLGKNNYETTLLELYPNAKSPFLTEWTDLTALHDSSKRDRIDKVKFAKSAIGRVTTLDELDLKQQMATLADFITKAN